MYTQCPECLTIYEIDEDALQASLGIVHCGRCDTRFDALRTLSDTLPEAPLTPLPERDLAERAPTLTEAVPPAAYASAARRRRPQRPAAEAAQHELELAPTAAAPDTGRPPTDGAADDWFASLESELTAASGTALISESDPPDITPALGAPDGEVQSAIDALAQPAAADECGHDPGTADSGVAIQEPPAATASGTDAAPAATVTPLTPAAAQAPVISPRLLEGDVFDESVMAHVDTVPDAAATPTGADLALPAETEEFQAGIPAEAAPDAPAGSLPDGIDTPPQEPGADASAAPTTPVYVRPRQRLLSASGLAWSLGCLLLALVLAAQLAWANRVELVRDPSTRAWTQRVCASIPCRLPPIRDVPQLELLSRDVRPDPNAQGALTITATVRNNASFRQPWPIVTVELTDFDNHAVAMRRFRPAEYMPDPARRAAGIAPGATAALAFEVADPGKRAGGYRFSFE